MPAASGGSRRRLWRRLSVAALPLILVLLALWQGLLRLEAGGLRAKIERSDLYAWLVMAAGTLLVAAAFWSRRRAVRILGYTFYSLLLAFGSSAAFVIAVVHAFGGPRGDLRAPPWALVGLGVAALACALGLLADAALLVDDIRSAEGATGDDGEGPRALV